MLLRFRQAADSRSHARIVSGGPVTARPHSGMTARPRTTGTGRRPVAAAGTRAARASDKERRRVDLACEEARRLFADNYR